MQVTPVVFQPPTIGISLQWKLSDFANFRLEYDKGVGFREQFQSQVRDLLDLPNSAKFTYLEGKP